MRCWRAWAISLRLPVCAWWNGPTANARGLRAADVRTGNGLAYTVMLDRGMDIGPANYGATGLAFISPVGFAHPAYYEPQGAGWLRTFGGGLLVGCGLTNVGNDSEDAGESLGVHGRLSLLPAQNVSIGQEWDGDACRFWVAGRCARPDSSAKTCDWSAPSHRGWARAAFRCMIVLRISGDKPSPLMILYHINLGFPLVDAESRLEAVRASGRASRRRCRAGRGRLDAYGSAPGRLS